MLTKSIIFLMILVVAVFQEAALVNFFPASVVPDALLILVSFWTIRLGFEKTWPRSIVAGLTLDLIHFWPLGVNMAGLTLISFAVSFLAKRFLVSQKIWKFIFLIVLSLISTFLLYLIYFFVGKLFSLSQAYPRLDAPGIFDLNLVYKILANMFLMFIIYWPVKKIENFLLVYKQRVISPKK